MNRFAVCLIVAGSITASACSGDSSHGWTDYADFELPSDGSAPDMNLLDPIVQNATEIVATDDYRLLLGDAPSEYGSPSFRCVQLVVGTGGIGCLEVDRQDGSSGGWSPNLRYEDQRIIWRGRTIPDGSESAIDHFVVWSSLEPRGRRIDPILASDSDHLIWAMEPGEEPWGIQAVDADGFLLRSESLVGLPGS